LHQSAWVTGAAGLPVLANEKEVRQAASPTKMATRWKKYTIGQTRKQGNTDGVL
jgi:hypothetical protein